ncbi:MAG: DinB family protein [SAR324 cluster bacterium]|nr:DinB family protein [SAR324 cluster bacterium]
MSDNLTEHFQSLARYNRLANGILYDACARLSDDVRKQVRPAFFKSIHGTLNHIMVGDRIWLTRFAGGEAPSTNLDAMLYENFAALRQAREAEDVRIEALLGGLGAEFMGNTIRYLNNEGNWHEDPVSLLLAHFFNHQTHHRGQIHDMLCQTEVAPPVLDMHRVLRPEPVR